MPLVGSGGDRVVEVHLEVGPIPLGQFPGGPVQASGTVFPVGTTTVTCAAIDKSGNKADNTCTVTVRDSTAPSLTVPTAKTVVATSAAGASVSFEAATATDIVDGSVPTSCDHATGSVFGLGTTMVTCSARDKAGNVATKSFRVTVTAAWSGVLQPVNPDGSSAFKLGSTVPVKFQLTGGQRPDQGPVRPVVPAAGRAGASATVSEAVSTSNATSGNLFRYDASSGQYIFNLGTKTLNAGSYQLRSTSVMGSRTRSPSR